MKKTTAVAVLAQLALVLSPALEAQGQAIPQLALDSISPSVQRVHERVTLRGSDFGSFVPGVSEVLFQGDTRTVAARRPYVWRDDFIEVQVPVGDANGPIPKEALTVTVKTGNGESNALGFQVVTVAGAAEFRERTEIVGGLDVSGFLGDNSLNLARTKDAEIADVDNDGYPDLIDNNSNNTSNGTWTYLRQNKEGEDFRGFKFEPRFSGDTGPFLATIPGGGDYPGSTVVYDADFVDLDNDGFLDWVQAANGSPTARVRVQMNNHLGQPARFLEATSTWFPNHTFSGAPDDVASADINYDGYLDIGVGWRFSSAGKVYPNQGGTNFGPEIVVQSPNGGSSIHDIFFLDADDDLFVDAVACDEMGTTTLHLHNGNQNNPQFIWDQSYLIDTWTGIAADFNADGLDDFVIAGRSEAEVYLNNPASPGSFFVSSLPDIVPLMYDVEVGDIDLDGDVDVVMVAANADSNTAVRVWANDGAGSFTNLTTPGADDLLPGLGAFQRMSADLIDYDLDLDLDLYLTGADGLGVPFGQAPNQFFENELIKLNLTITGSCPGPLTVDITRASKSDRVAIVGGTAPDSHVIQVGACAGTEIGLENPQLLKVTEVDANGDASFDVNSRQGACDLFIQLVDLNDCAVSNVVEMP